MIGVIENMSGLTCPHCGKALDLFGTGGGEDVCEEMDVPFLGRIPIDPEMVRSGDSGDPYMVHCRSTPAARAFSRIAEALLSELGQPVTGKAEVKGLEP